MLFAHDGLSRSGRFDIMSYTEVLPEEM
jgi:hypothetical protein